MPCLQAYEASILNLGKFLSRLRLMFLYDTHLKAILNLLNETETT